MDVADQLRGLPTGRVVMVAIHHPDPDIREKAVDELDRRVTENKEGYLADEGKTMPPLALPR